MTASRTILTLVLALAPIIVADAESPFDAVWAAWNAGESEAARAEAERLVAENPDDAMAHAVLGYILDAEGDEGRADTALTRAIELGGSDVDVLRLAADVHATRFGAWVGTDLDSVAGEQARQAEDLYARWSDAAPGSSEPLVRIAWIRKTGGDRTSALGLLFAAVAREPLADAPHAELWSFLNNEVDYDQLAAFYEGLALGAADPAVESRGWNYQGQLIRYKGDKLRMDGNRAGDDGDVSGQVSALEEAASTYARSVPCFERAIAADPAFAAEGLSHVVQSHANIAGVYADLGDRRAVGRATEKGEIAVRACAETTEPATAKRAIASYLTSAAEAFGSTNDLAATIAAAERAKAALLDENAIGSDEFKNDVDRLSYAMFVASGGEGGAADGMIALRKFWQWATGIVADDAQWWNNYGFFARESQSYEESYAAYNRCIELAPANVRYVNDAGLIQLYHLRTDLTRAEELFQRAVEMGAEQYPAAQDDPVAEADMRSAWGDAMLNLGRLYTELGRYDEAAAAFDRLAEVDGTRADLYQSRFALTLARGDVSGMTQAVDRNVELLRADPADREVRMHLFMIRTSITDRLKQGANPELTELLGKIEDVLGTTRDDRDETR